MALRVAPPAEARPSASNDERLDERGISRHTPAALVSRLRPITLLLLAQVALACSAASPPSAAPDAAGQVALRPERDARLHGALTDYVPAAGLRWLVTGSPRQLASASSLSELRQRWLTPARLASFARVTGIDLEQTERGLIAGFDLGTLYLADASGWVSPPEQAFLDRLAGSELVRQPHPRITTLSGLAGTRPEALVHVEHELVAVAVGDLALARVVESFAAGRFEHVASAFEGAALSTLPAELLAPLPLAIYVPGPLDPERLGDSTGLVAAAAALAVTLHPAAAQLTLELALAGHWLPDVDGTRLREAWARLAASALGHALALDTPREPASVAGSESLLRLRTQLDGQSFARGLEKLLTGNVGDLLDGVPAPPAAGHGAAPASSRDRPLAAHRVMHASAGAVHHGADDEYAFDIGGRSVQHRDLGRSGSGEPRSGARVPEGRLDQRGARLGRFE